jgi:hypothetical protein
VSVDLAARHPATQEKMRWLTPNPRLPDGPPAIVSAMFYDLGDALLGKVSDGPQLTIALQRLVDAKDAAVRQAVADAG